MHVVFDGFNIIDLLKIVLCCDLIHNTTTCCQQLGNLIHILGKILSIIYSSGTSDVQPVLPGANLLEYGGDLDGFSRVFYHICAKNIIIMCTKH